MKKNVILFLVLCVVSVGAYFVTKSAGKKSTMSSLSEERAFTVESPDIIGKIVVKRQNEKPLVFEKNGSNGWMLNEKYRADDVVVGYMVQVLTKAKMKSIPSKKASPKIVEKMEEQGIEVEVFNKEGEMLKKIYLGSDLQDGNGTYMLLDGFSQPYAMELPSLGGGLRSRFEQPIERYRDKFIYRDPVDKIRSVKVEYHDDPEASYIIENTAGAMKIMPLSGNPAANKGTGNPAKLKTYLGFFEELGAEIYYNHFIKKDSLLAIQPFCTITLTTTDNTAKTYRYWDYDAFVNKSENRTKSDEAIHIGRFFVHTGEDLLTVQTGVFGKIFSAYPYFF